MFSKPAWKISFLRSPKLWEHLCLLVLSPQHKHARIIPLLRKSNLDANILSNYRPISNLPFIGKIIERIAIQQLQTYLSENNLHARMQSAYRSFHSVETALLKVQNDILRALDKHQEALLLLLDFSAAFDTIDHNQLLNRLTSRYGVKGKVLQWISSYLNGRTQSVAIGNVLSDPVDLNCGVPQGSVADPLIFTLFSAPLQDIIESHGLQSVVYADDTQIYFTFPPKDRLLAVQKIESCVADIRSWCQRNWLVLNDGKTELMYITSKFIRNRTEWKPAIKIGNAIIQPSPLARNLGVIMDSSLNMSSHVNNVCKSAMFGIRNIGQIRQYLTQDSTAKLIHAFVTSKLDSCNSLLFGLMDRDVMKVQRVQNTAARLVLRVISTWNITPALESLHWLPIQQRAVYKILLITFKGGRMGRSDTVSLWCVSLLINTRFRFLILELAIVKRISCYIKTKSFQMTQGAYQVIKILPIKSKMAAAKKRCFFRFLYLTESSPPSFKVPRFTNDCKFGISVSTYHAVADIPT